MPTTSNRRVSRQEDSYVGCLGRELTARPPVPADPSPPPMFFQLFRRSSLRKTGIFRTTNAALETNPPVGPEGPPPAKALGHEEGALPINMTREYQQQLKKKTSGGRGRRPPEEDVASQMQRLLDLLEPPQEWEAAPPGGQRPRPAHWPPSETRQSELTCKDVNSNSDVNRTSSGQQTVPTAAPKSTHRASVPPSADLFQAPTARWRSPSWAANPVDWQRKRQSDLEEIRRKLAMESDSEDCCNNEQCNKLDSSVHYHSGVNLQICFVNELASDQESQGSDQESCEGSWGVMDELVSQKSKSCSPKIRQIERTKKTKNTRGTTNNNRMASKRHRTSLLITQPHNLKVKSAPQLSQPMSKEDIITQHTRLQAEARLALAQAKDMARMQMEIEKQKKKSSVTVIVGIPFPDGMHKMSRQFLKDMNLAQLQVIVNDLHTQIENLNEELVRLLLERDDLHMEQDSMLVDVEDFTRYLGLKNPQSADSVKVMEPATDNKRVALAESGWKQQNKRAGRSRLMYKIAGLF